MAFHTPFLNSYIKNSSSPRKCNGTQIDNVFRDFARTSFLSFFLTSVYADIAIVLLLFSEEIERVNNPISSVE